MKKWYNSKTIWVNAIALILGFISMFNAEIFNIFGFTDNTTVKVLTVIGLINGALNILLRFLTTGEIITNSKKHIE